MNVCGTVSHAQDALMLMKTDLWHVPAAGSGHILSVTAWSVPQKGGVGFVPTVRGGRDNTITFF